MRFPNGTSTASSRLDSVTNGWVVAFSDAPGAIVALGMALDVDPHDFLGFIEAWPLDRGYPNVKERLITDDAPTYPIFNAEKAGEEAELKAADAARNRPMPVSPRSSKAARSVMARKAVQTTQFHWSQRVITARLTYPTGQSALEYHLWIE